MTANPHMKELDITKILEKVPNKFLLCVAAAKRARQLKEGIRPSIEISQDEDIVPVVTALEEILAGKVTVVVRDASHEEELLDKMDQHLTTELSNDEKEEKEGKDDKKAKETKSKSKSKSLAA